LRENSTFLVATDRTLSTFLWFLLAHLVYETNGNSESVGEASPVRLRTGLEKQRRT
jgi:hypothetical protein